MDPGNIPSEAAGTALRAARVGAGFLTIRAFADALADYGLVYGEDTLSKYETDQRKPARAQLLPLCSFLAQRGGLHHPRDVNRILWLLGLRNLDPSEIQQYFSELARVAELKNLPAQPPYDRLVGRDELIQRISTQVLNTAGMPIIVVSGLGGIGKTALAYEVTQRVIRTGRFAHLAWESLKSEDFLGTERRERVSQELDFPVLLARIARQLGLTLPPDPSAHELQEALRNHLLRGESLVVIDNFESMPALRDAVGRFYELVTPVTASSPSRILITSRERLADEVFVFDVFLEGLSEAATLELLQNEAISRGVDSLLPQLEKLRTRIFEITGGMPLALKLLVSQYALGIGLTEALDRLEEAVGEEELYRFIYFAIWEKLSLDAQSLLSLIASFGISVSRELLLDMAEWSPNSFNQAVRQLVRMSLVSVEVLSELNMQRYSIHPMTRWFINAPLVELWHKQKSRTESDRSGG